MLPLDGVDVVLLDVGGVLVDDYWERVLLGRDGVAERFGLGLEETKSVGEILWGKYCRSELEECDYWLEVNDALGINLSRNTIRELDKLVKPTTFSDHILHVVEKAGVRVGLISNNTSFCVAA